MSEALINKTTVANSSGNPPVLRQSRYVATAAEAMKNYARNTARTWYENGVDPDDPTGKDNLVRSTHKPDVKLRRPERNSRAPRADTSGYETHPELSRGDRYPWACRSVA